MTREGTVRHTGDRGAVRLTGDRGGGRRDVKEPPAYSGRGWQLVSADVGRAWGARSVIGWEVEQGVFFFT